MNMTNQKKQIKILDLKVDLKLINQSEFARRLNMSQSLVNQIFHKVRTNNTSVRRVRDALLKYYSPPVVMQDKETESKSKLKKTA